MEQIIELESYIKESIEHLKEDIKSFKEGIQTPQLKMTLSAIRQNYNLEEKEAIPFLEGMLLSYEKMQRTLFWLQGPSALLANALKEKTKTQ